MPSPDEAAWEETLIADVRANGGRPSAGPLAGHPLALMFTTGAKSGQQRRSIVTYSTQGDGWVIAGTAGGSNVDPAWIANIRKDPNVQLELENRTFPAVAEIAEGDERDRLWNEHVAQLPWFAKYQEQVEREIPVVKLRAA
jgi:deazaflavin-dependent oxidoreductase (nitroreductase family)